MPSVRDDWPGTKGRSSASRDVDSPRRAGTVGDGRAEGPVEIGRDRVLAVGQFGRFPDVQHAAATAAERIVDQPRAGVKRAGRLATAVPVQRSRLAPFVDFDDGDGLGIADARPESGW